MIQLLKDKVAIITGGTAGIGRRIALQFAEHGAKIAIFGTNQERGELVVEEIRLAGNSQALFYQVNVAQTDDVNIAVQKVLSEFGQVDILLNNAGITIDKLLMKMEEADWDNVMDINAKSCYNTCRAVVRSMIRARNGKIINMSSVIGLTGNAGQVNYSASKAAIIGLTKALAKELAARGICVNCLAPGFIETRMTDTLTPQQKESTLASIPLGRMGTTSDISNAALFLASSMSDYITGQVLAVDGGMVM